jgi:hypothetical protein
MNPVTIDQKNTENALALSTLFRDDVENICNRLFSRFGGMDVSEAQPLSALEEDNRQLKRTPSLPAWI